MSFKQEIEKLADYILNDNLARFVSYVERFFSINSILTLRNNEMTRFYGKDRPLNISLLCNFFLIIKCSLLLSNLYFHLSNSGLFQFDKNCSLYDSKSS